MEEEVADERDGLRFGEGDKVDSDVLGVDCDVIRDTVDGLLEIDDSFLQK